MCVNQGKCHFFFIVYFITYISILHNFCRFYGALCNLKPLAIAGCGTDTCNANCIDSAVESGKKKKSFSLIFSLIFQSNFYLFFYFKFITQSLRNNNINLSINTNNFGSYYYCCSRFRSSYSWYVSSKEEGIISCSICCTGKSNSSTYLKFQ